MCGAARWTPIISAILSRVTVLGTDWTEYRSWHCSVKPYTCGFQINVSSTWSRWYLTHHMCVNRQSQWSRSLRCKSAATCLLILWVRSPPGAWMFVCYECCVLSGRGLCDELITYPEESYRMWCIIVCDLETTWIRRPWPTGAVAPKTNKNYVLISAEGELLTQCFVTPNKLNKLSLTL